MDSYDFSRYLGRPASPPLPDGHSGDYLPQMPAYSDTSPSGCSSGVPQPIDFGGSVTGYCCDASQSQHSSVPQIEYGSAPQSGGATGGSASQRTSSRRGYSYPNEEKSAMLTAWRDSEESQSAFCKRKGIPRTTFVGWVKEAEAGGSSQSHRPRRTYTAEGRAAAVTNWWNSNEPQRVYAKSIGIPHATLRTWIEEAGSSTHSLPHSTHSRNYYTPEEKSAMLSEWQARRKTESLAAFSERTGIPRRTLQDWIKQEKDSSKDAR